MTHFREFYSSDYVGVWDLPNGEDRTVTITRVKQGEVGGQQGRKKDRAPLAFFAELDVPMIINKTNGDTIARLYGPHVEGWKGKRITLFASTTDFGQKRNIPCIRVRPRVPKGEPTPGPRRSEPNPDQREAQKRASGDWKDGDALRSVKNGRQLLDAVRREAAYIDADASGEIWAWVQKKGREFKIEDIELDATLSDALEQIAEASR